MMLEDQNTERKSLRKVTGKGADWDGLARTCVSFANGSGGRLLIGIEDGAALPPPGQRLPAYCRTDGECAGSALKPTGRQWQ